MAELPKSMKPAADHLIDFDPLLISGHRRVNACKKLGIKEIESEIKEFSDLLVIESNRYREKTWEEKLKEAEALERMLKPKAKEKKKESGGAVPQKSDKPPIDILKETAASPFRKFFPTISISDFSGFSSQESFFVMKKPEISL